MAMIVPFFWIPTIHYFEWNRSGESAALACMVMFPIAWYRLSMAYGKYLRFHQAILLTLASQIIVALALLGFTSRFVMS